MNFFLVKRKKKNYNKNENVMVELKKWQTNNDELLKECKLKLFI